MSPRRDQYGSVFQYQTFEKPFNYQTFDWHSCKFTNHPIIPTERIRFSDRHTDDLYKSDDAATEPELEDTSAPSPEPDPVEPMAGDDPPEGGGMFT